MGGDKYFTHIFGYLFHFFDAASFGNFIHQFTAVKALVIGHLFKIGIDFEQFVVVHHIAHKAKCKQGLDAAGAAGDNAQCTGRGDGGAGGVAQFDALVFVYAFIPVGKYPALVGQILGRFVGVFLYETHDRFGSLQRFL